MSKIIERGQPGNGLEAAELFGGVAKPRWYRGMSWFDLDGQLVWRADEVELVTASPVRSGGPIREGLELSGAWWRTLNTSLDNLAGQHTTRIATPDTETITQALVTATVEKVFGPEVDTTVTDYEWVPAHADLTWANVTHPECCLLDWEDHGRAPRGLDSAMLWIGSVGIAGLAERVRHERRTDLNTRPGRVMALFCCAKILADSSTPQLLVTPTRAVADDLLDQLRRSR